MKFQPELKVLSDEQIYDIHQAALEILWKTGVLVRAPAARDLLRRAGAWVDDETGLCRIPGYVVEEALKRAPSSFTVYAREPANDVHVSTRAVHYEPMIGRLNSYDYATGTTHRTTLKDVGDLVRLADALPSYHLLHSGAIMPQIDGVPIRATHV
jgi:trimethylamine---corrinoid protein Co-methyltransferase